MALTLSPLKEDHIEDAAKLVSFRYKQLCRKELNLPACYSVFRHIDERITAI